MSRQKRVDLILSAVAGKRAGSTGWARANCPLCEMRQGTADRKNCLGLNVLTGRWLCHRCGAGGHLAVPDDWDRPVVTPAALEERAAMEPPDGFELLYEEPGWSSHALRAARRYMRGRGFDDDLGFDAKIGAVVEGRLSGRVVVPIFADDGETWFGWSARAYFKNPFLKVLYPKGMQRQSLIYNHAALLAPDNGIPVIVTEAVFDALSVWPDGVACLGKPTMQQFEALIASRRPVVMALDGDAHREAEAWAIRLRFEGVKAGSVHIPPTLDPNTVPRAALVRAACRAAERGEHVWLDVDEPATADDEQPKGAAGGDE